MVDNVLSIRNLNIYFGPDHSAQGLYDVNLDIPTGKVTAIIGASGSGKSITSLAILGLLPPNVTVTGEIIFQGDNLLAIDKKSWNNIRGKSITMVFQEPMSALNPLMTCGEQLLEVVLVHQKLTRQVAKDLVLAWMDKVQLPDPYTTFHKYPHELSGGQKQRIMIAMAMINEPALLIADEPTTALDVLVQQEIISLLKQLQAETGTAIIFITHDLALAQQIADEIIEMKAGKIVVRTLSVRDNEPKSTYPLNTGIPLLSLQDVSVQYPLKDGSRFTAVDGVRLDVYPMETVGIVGGSGSGKTTLSKAILGLVPIAAGHILYKEADLSTFSAAAWRKIRKDIQIIYQDPYAALNPRLRVGDAIAEPLRVHTRLSTSNIHQQVLEMLLAVGLSEDDYYKYPHQFSGGQRQRIAIARALILHPHLVICDESVAALDIIVQGQILQLLMDVQQQFQMTYIFITHDMQVVKQICDRVVVMEQGKVVEMNFTKEILERPQHVYTQKIIEAIP